METTLTFPSPDNIPVVAALFDIEGEELSQEEFNALFRRRRIPGTAPVASQSVASAPVTKNRQYYIQAVTVRWNKTLDGIIDIGTLLNDAKLALTAVEFATLTKKDLPFDYSVIRKFMAIAASPRICDPANRPFLPPSWNTLYEISQMSDLSFQEFKAKNLLTPKVQWKQVKAHRDVYEPTHRRKVSPKVFVAGGVCIQLTKQQNIDLHGRTESLKSSIAALLTHKFHFSSPKVQLKVE